MIGIVQPRGFNADRGYCFVQGDDGRHYFLHAAKLIDMELEESLIGQSLEFDTGQTDKGFVALNAREATATGDKATGEQA